MKETGEALADYIIVFLLTMIYVSIVDPPDDGLLFWALAQIAFVTMVNVANVFVLLVRLFARYFAAKSRTEGEAMEETDEE